MKNGKRDYRTEYNRYHSRKREKIKRASRNAARREYEEKHGNLPASKDVDHIIPLSKGGTNSSRNIRAISRYINRSFKRTKKGAIA